MAVDRIKAIDLLVPEKDACLVVVENQRRGLWAWKQPALGSAAPAPFVLTGPPAAVAAAAFATAAAATAGDTHTHTSMHATPARPPGRTHAR